MSPPERRNGPPVQGPAVQIATATTPQDQDQHSPGTVHVRHGRFSSLVRGPREAAVSRRVPVSGREWDPTARAWRVFGSRVPTLLAGLRADGYTVVEDAL